MELINRVKLRLEKFIGNKADKSIVKPIKIIEENGKYYLILKKIHTPNSYLFTRSLDGFDFDLLENFEKPDNFADKFNSSYPAEVGGAFLFPKGIIVLFFEKIIENGLTYYKAYLAEFDKKKPDKMLWKTEAPIWNSKDHWPGKKAISLGSVMIKNKIIMYWYIDEEIIYGVYLSGFFYNPQSIHQVSGRLHKPSNNPIITPRPQNHWEAFTTLNPAATYINNKVHILYRAQGYDYISSVGYAVSSDGVTIDNRLNYPIYQPSAKFETNSTDLVNPELMSAGGWGGCEDPRVTLIDGRVYMVYVAFDGWSSLRLALTSIDLNDFLNQRWNWEKPVLISPPHVINKSGCLLPEKINGKYVFFHRVFPNILIDFVDDLNFKGKNKWLTGQYKIKVRPRMWDSRKIGAGAPPLKTKDGWLLIYYGVDERNSSNYHIGAMLLDLKDPTRVLYRTDKPILSPQEEYETNGFKPGIAYPCGAVIIKDNLFIYYGAADTTVCVAKANLNKFLNNLKTDRLPKLSPILIKEVSY